MFCRVGFLGHEDIAPVYASADAHVSCSQFETLGNTGKRLRQLMAPRTPAPLHPSNVLGVLPCWDVVPLNQGVETLQPNGSRTCLDRPSPGG